MNRKIAVSLFSIIIFLLLDFFFLSKDVIAASSLLWQKANGIVPYSQEVRIAPSDPKVVYATSRDSTGGSALYKSSDGGLNFSVDFPTTTGRDVNSIAISYTNPDKLCIGTYEMGVFCRNGLTGSDFTNYGWINSGLTGKVVRFVAIDPNNDNIFYAGTGENNNGGIFKTENGGDSWTNVGNTTYGIRNCLNIVVSKFDSSIIFAGADETLWRSDNAGSSWVSLPLGGNTNSPATVIDNASGLRIYSEKEGSGVFRSYDSGNSWSKKNINIESAWIFRLAQDSDGTLYGSRRARAGETPIGGVWRTARDSDVWQNVGDNWGNVDTWGLDVGGGRVIVSVGNSGIYVANTDGSAINPPATQEAVCDGLTTTPESGNVPLAVTAALSGHTNNGGSVASYRFDFGDGSGLVSQPGNSLAHTFTSTGVFTVKGFVVDNLGNVAGGSGNCQKAVTVSEPPPPAGPNPVVFIPGFGASWSYKGLIQNQSTTYSDWQLLPRFTDYFYQPLINTITRAGLPLNEKLFVFAYDYRQSISDSASWLNDYLAAVVLPKNAGKKANVAGHSLGGLVARYCFEKVPGCSDKINRIITGGSPHLGTLEAYEFWEGGKITEKDLMTRFAERLLLQVSGFPKVRSADIIQSKVPGVRDVLPIFDYIFGKPYSSLSPLAKNPKLESLQPASASLNNVLTAFSGTNQKTPQMFEITKPSIMEKLLGFWTDGKPKKTVTGNGDQTVLKTSSEVLTAQNKYYSVKHGDYFNNKTVLADLLAIFGLTGSPAVSTTVQPQTLQVVYATEGTEVSAQDEKGNSVGTVTDDGKTIFLDRDIPHLKIQVKGRKDTSYKINRILVNLSDEPQEREFTGSVKRGQTRQHSL